MPQAPEAPVASMRYGAIAALAGSAFVYFTGETLPVGLLPQISASLHVSPATVGLLVTIYAAVAAAGAVPLTNLTMRLPRHVLITGLVLVFVVSQGLAAIAPDFPLLVAARTLTALTHGVFWSVMAPVATRLAPRGHGGRASSLVMAGNTAGMVLGVPLATILGQTVGWRASYGVLAVAGLVSAIAVHRTLPRFAGASRQESPSIVGQIVATVRLAGKRQLIVVCACTTFVGIGQYAAYTYIAPIVERTGGISGSGLSVLLLGYGAVGLGANVLVGRLVDRRPGAAFVGCLGAMAVALLTLSIVHDPLLTVLAVLVWGAGYAAVPLIVQISAMRVSPGARDAASAVRQSAMQAGIAGGSLVGGLIYRGGHLEALAPFGLAMTLVFLVVVLVARRTFPLRLADLATDTGAVRTA